MIFPHTMPLSRADKEEIRTRVLLELNAAFVNIAGRFGGDKDQESYITLIEKKVKQMSRKATLTTGRRTTIKRTRDTRREVCGRQPSNYPCL